MKNKIFNLSIVLSFLFYSVAVFSQDMAYLHKNAVDISESTTAKERVNKFVYEVEWLKTNELEHIDAQYVDRHFLGQEIAKKRYLLDETFTKRVPIAPGNPSMKTEITKPALYYAVNDVEKYLRRALRKGQVSEEQARAHMHCMLDAILNTYYLETDELEEKVRACDCPEEMISIFVEDTEVVYTVVK